MTAEEFVRAVWQYQWFLDPKVYKALTEKAGELTDELRSEALAKIKETGDQMEALYRYQEKRLMIKKMEAEKMQQACRNVEIKFKEMVQTDEKNERASAEKETAALFDNL